MLNPPIGLADIVVEPTGDLLRLQQKLVDAVALPHVTIGVGTEAYLKEMLAEPFDAFRFSPTGASVYQLGSFGTARKELKALALEP